MRKKHKQGPHGWIKVSKEGPSKAGLWPRTRACIIFSVCDVEPLGLYRGGDIMRLCLERMRMDVRGAGVWEEGRRVAWTRVQSTGWRDQVRLRICATAKPIGCYELVVGCGVRWLRDFSLGQLNEWRCHLLK